MVKDSIIVFVENDSNRAALQYQRMNKEDRERTFWVRNVEEAIDILKDYRRRLDIVSFGYDLNDNKGFNHFSREDCGMEIVRWLEAKDPSLYSHVRFIIHTWNNFAGNKMVKRLKHKGYRVIYVPFGLKNYYGR